MDWLKKLSLASVFYPLARLPNGPISKIEVASFTSLVGERIFEAHTYLKAELITVPSQKIYGDAHGTGTHGKIQTAIDNSISEALERWAFYNCLESDSATLYGFDVNPTSTGMAAYPSFSTTPVRRIALLEALERWALTHWWQGQISIKELPLLPDQTTGWELLVPLQDSAVVLLTQVVSQNREKFLATYGFAAGFNVKHATEKAIIELDRNRRNLLVFLALEGCAESIAKLSHDSFDLSERRLLYFSTREGHDKVLERIEASSRKTMSKINPQLLVDSQLKGPWSKYAKVWRCLFKENQILDESVDNFLF